MNQSLFNIPTTAFRTQLKDIAKPYGPLSKANKHLILEITITKQLITLVVPGARFEIYCETRGTCKATIGFFYFIDIIKSQKSKSVICIISDKTIEINGLKIAAQTTFFEDDSILRSIKLPLNYTDYHLLRLDAQGYTIEELKFNKMYTQILQAKRTRTRFVRSTAQKLKIYGVTEAEIDELVNRKLFGAIGD